MRGQISGHEVHVIGEILPGSGHPLHFGLSAELSVRANLTSHARHFAGEGIKLVHHRVDGVLQLENFALNIDGDFAGEVAIGDRGSHLGDIANLRRQVPGHRVHAIGEILPGSGDSANLGLAAELALGADLTRDARHLGCEGAELIHHGIDSVLQLKNFAAHVHGDLAR